MPSKRLGLAVIGVGHWGPNLIRSFYEDTRVDLRLICDVDKERLQAIAACYHGIETTARVEDVIANKGIDAAIICTPTNTHYSLAKQCLRAGKHLLVEKPMATSAAECEELIELAQGEKLKLMVGHVFLYNPAIQYIDGLIEGGDLGDILYIYGTRVNLGPVRRDVNAMWDLAPHDISIVNYWLGTGPTSVNAIGQDYLNPPLQDVVFMSLKYPQKIFVNLHVSWLDPRKIRQIVVVGTKRMVVFNDLDPMGPVHIFDKTVTRQHSKKEFADTIQDYKIVVQEGDLVIPKLPHGEPLKNECRSFVEWILTGTEPVSTGKEGLAVVKVLEALSQSLESSGSQVFLEPSR